MTQETAEVIALQAMAWLAETEDLLRVFMGATGTGPDDLHGRVGDPDYLVAVLDFISMDDEWVRRFCSAHGLPFEAPWQARQALPGGQDVNWT